jgi:neutral ceramidase
MVLAALLSGCGDDGERLNAEPETAPLAGMAEGYADFPVGTPLGGYTARCRCFGNQGRYDARRTNYHDQFNPSVGVQTQPKIVALWIESQGQDLVLLKTDAIYTFEGIVNTLAERLSTATGRDLRGKVVVASNHSHSAPANFDQGLTWYLGGDKFNREVFERVVASMTDIALRAWNRRVPAAIGIGQTTNWDPQNRVYSDRRGENDGRVFFDDIPAGPYKDPYLTVLRVDTATGDPIGMMFAFGMHGTVAGESNQLWSVEAPGHVEAAVEERFDRPVIVGYMQHGGGDASPRGVDHLFARMESIGDFAAGAILDLWQRTPTSNKPFRLESVTRSIDTWRDVLRVHRDYGVLEYLPYNADPNFRPDEMIFDAQGRVLTPLDEFNARMGGAFCGSSSPQLPLGGVGSRIYPYASCLEVATLSGAIGLFFGFTEVDLPLPESLRAKTTATRMGPVAMRTAAGQVIEDNVLMGFFPGETTATYTEQFRRRAAAELGMQHAIPIGYAQDHQGYLLIPEDWLLGGYEPNINIWGPLQGEHIMEGLLTAAGEVLSTEAIEPHDPLGEYGDPVYAETALETNAPDLTPDAGTALSAPPSYFLIPIPGLIAAVAPPAQVRRVQDVVQFMWEGGDPGVDLPVVHVERQLPDGTWEALRTAAGRTLASPMHDILLATTPNPLAPAAAVQRHYWWLGWQAVTHVLERPGLPLGSYRLHIYGRTYSGGAQTWPWPSAAYELISPVFEVIPAEISLSLQGSVLTGSIDAPATGFRLIDIEGNSRGPNPVRGATLTAIRANGERHAISAVREQVVGQRTSWTLDAGDLEGAASVEVVDQYGNRGTLQIVE